MALALEYLKKHTRTDDYEDDDEQLIALGETALEAIVHDLGYDTTSEFLEAHGIDGDYPLTIKQAACMLVDFWYNTERSAASMSNYSAVPFGIAYSIRWYAKLPSQS